MELTDIMALVKAGYTKDEISRMEVPTPANAEPVPNAVPDDKPVAEPQPAPAQVVQPVAVPVAVPAPAPEPVQPNMQNPVQNQPTMSDIMQSIAKLTSAVQANAIAQSVIPGGMPNPPQAEDMLAEIIRPTYGGKKND